MQKEKHGIKNSPLLKRLIKEGESISRRIMDKMINSGDPQDVEKFRAISKVRNARKQEEKERLETV